MALPAAFSRVATGFIFYLGLLVAGSNYRPRFCVSPDQTCVTVSGLVIDSSWLLREMFRLDSYLQKLLRQRGGRCGSALINALSCLFPTVEASDHPACALQGWPAYAKLCRDR